MNLYYLRLAAASLQSKPAPQKVSSTTQMNEVCTNTTISLNEMNRDTRSKVSKDTTIDHTVTTTDDRSAKHYDDNTISQTPQILQTPFAKTQDFTILNEDNAIDDDVQNTFQIPSTSKSSQLNNTVGFCLISFGL